MRFFIVYSPTVPIIIANKFLNNSLFSEKNKLKTNFCSLFSREIKEDKKLEIMKSKKCGFAK
jgi:hypothetical protein